MPIRVLNIGCGDLLDVGTDFIDLVPQDPRVIKVDANEESFPYPDNTFDEVYARNMVELVYNPEHFFSECNRVLKVNGKIRLIVANATAIERIIGNKNTGYDLKGSHQKGFLVFTKPIMVNWLSRYGFTEIAAEFGTTRTTNRSLIFRMHRAAIILVSLLVPKFNSQIICEAIKSKSLSSKN